VSQHEFRQVEHEIEAAAGSSYQRIREGQREWAGQREQERDRERETDAKPGRPRGLELEP
jgi:hypothetical protein